MKQRNRDYCLNSGFSLVELLVVIGIIAVLIGVLIPVVSSARKAAYAADSRNQIQVISNAIERYNTDYNAYPGVFSNAAITAGVSGSVKDGTTTVGTFQLTQSENLVIALCGGLEAASAGYQLADVGRGPLTQNAIAPRRMPAYLEATSTALSIKGSDLDGATHFGNGADAVPANVGKNTGMPEFIDRFPQSMPVLYLRANRTNAGIYHATTDASQYNLAHLSPYWDAAASWSKSHPGVGVSHDDFPANTAAGLSAGPEAYFGDAATSTPTLPLPKRKDSYMLISPGEDRLYGTIDDICNFSF